MALRLPHGKPVAMGLLLAVVAGCTSTDTSAPLSTAAGGTPPAAQAARADSMSRVEGATAVDAGPDGRVYDLAVDPAGNPVVLIVDEQGALTVDRPRLGDQDNASWTRQSLDNLRSRPGVGSIAVGPEGDLFVAGSDGEGLLLARIDSTGAVTTTQLVEGLRLSTVTDVTTALAPEGDVLYLAYAAYGGGVRTPVLQAVDTGTGEVIADAELVSGISGAITPTQIVVSPSGDRVFVAMQVGSGADGNRQTATLQRLTGELEPRGEVPLVHGEILSRAAQLVAGADGSAYATLIVGDVGVPGTEVRLVAAPAAAVAATAVASFPDLDDVAALAVDSSGGWAYLGGLANLPDPLALTITPVDLRTGQSRGAIQLCARGELADMVLVEGRDEAWIGGRCLDKGFASELWTLR